jgi:hypothetical protein
MTKQEHKNYSLTETEKRREDALKRMLSTPHKAHEDSKAPRKPKKAPTKPKSA